jgi:hypothetical protein
VRRFSVRLYAETTLQVRGQAVHEPWPNDGMALELHSQSLQERVALSRVDRRGGLHDGVVFGISEAERHGRGTGRARRHDGAGRDAT